MAPPGRRGRRLGGHQLAPSRGSEVLWKTAKLRVPLTKTVTSFENHITCTPQGLNNNGFAGLILKVVGIYVTYFWGPGSFETQWGKGNDKLSRSLTF